MEYCLLDVPAPEVYFLENYHRFGSYGQCGMLYGHNRFYYVSKSLNQ